MEDKFTVISAPSQGLYKEKGSRFMSFAYPLSSEDEAGEIIKSLSLGHHSARHIAYAYRMAVFGGGPEIWRASDGGEPSGTAGRPILGQIDSCGLSNVLVAVVRYFGGILLGAPGLMRAYRSAAADALANASFVERTATARRRISFGYGNLPAVENVLKTSGISVLSRAYTEVCEAEVEIPLSLLEEICEKLKIIANFKDELN